MEPTAKEFMEQLGLLKSITELKNVQRFYRDKGTMNRFLGIRMAAIFKLARQFDGMQTNEIENLLQSEYYEERMGAVSIMDFQARSKNLSADKKRQLYELYIRRHDRINNWDMVDRSAPYVVGGYLFDKDRTLLYQLAKSKKVWERRTSIVATYYFIRQNDVEETFKIAEILIRDEHDLIQKAVGSWLREAGKKDNGKLLSFLDKYAVTMPRTTLRYAVEKLTPEQKNSYLKQE